MNYNKNSIYINFWGVSKEILRHKFIVSFRKEGNI